MLTLVASSDAGIGTADGTFVSGDYLYVADGQGGLEIVDISDPTNTVVIGSFNSYPNPSASVVFVAGNYAYVGDQNGALDIFDVSAPVSPMLVGSYPINNYPYSTSVAVSGNYAYINDLYDHAVIAVDVSNPSAPVLVTSIMTPSSHIGPSYPSGVTVAGNYLYVADYSPAIDIVNISDPTHPSIVGTYATSPYHLGPGVTSAPNALTVSGNYLYVADADTGLYILNISNPASPVIVGSYDPGGIGNHYSGVQVEGNFAFVSDVSGNLIELNVSNPTAPTLVESLNIGGTPRGLSVVGNYAYVADDSNGVEIINLGSPTSIVPPPTLSIIPLDANKAEGNSGITPFTFEVVRSGDTTGTTTVDWSATGGQSVAANASDFVGGSFPSGSITFNPGDSIKTLTVNVQGDTVFEPNENFVVNLGNATSGAVIDSLHASANGQIINDDAAPPPLPDLTVMVTLVGGNTTLNPGGSVAVVYYSGEASGPSIVLRESFSGSFVPTAKVGLYLSADSVITTSDLLLDGDLPLSSNGVFGAQLPFDIAPGHYYLGLIVDPFNTIVESNENNNASAGIAITVVAQNQPPVIDPFVPYTDAQPGQPAPADVVNAAAKYENSLWFADNCTGLVWAVAKSIGTTFYDNTTQLTGYSGQQQIVPDSTLGYVVPHGAGTSGSWVTVTSSNWQALVQPGDLVRLPGTDFSNDLNDQAGHSFIVIAKDSQGDWSVIDNTNPYTADTFPTNGSEPYLPITLHTFNAFGSGSVFANDVLDASVAYVSRLTSASNSFSYGTVADGYIAGATVFADANGNGKLDAGEVSTTTDTNGNFTLAGGTGPLVATGGLDVSTVLPFIGLLEAPAGSTAITPLTTVISLLQSQGSSNAETQVLAAFGIDPSTELTTFDPIVALSEGNPSGAKAYVAGAEVMNTVTMIASAFTNTGTTSANTVDVFAVLANLIGNGGQDPLDLTDTSLLTQLVTTSADALHQSLDPTLVLAVVSLVAASNSALEESTPRLNGQPLIDSVSEIERLAQGASSNALEQAAGNSHLIPIVVNAFTGANLTAALSPLSTDGNHAPSLATDLVPSHGVSELAGVTGSLAVDALTGELLFTDADFADLHQASARLDSVKWVEADGTASLDSLPTGLLVVLGNSVQSMLLMDSTNGKVGEISWSFGVQDKNIDFLGAGDKLIVTYDVSVMDDHGSSSTEPVTITITGANDIPVANADSYSVTLGHVLHVASGVLSNDSDADHDPLTATVQTSPAHGSLTLSLDGSFSYAPNVDFVGNGTDTFTYKVNDGTASSAAATVTISISEGSDTYDFSHSAGNTTVSLSASSGTAITTAGVQKLGAIDNVMGGSGNDTLVGNNLGNILNGGAGNDTIRGGTGNDFLIGGAGNDRLTGGGGNDTLVFRAGFGHDTVTDFLTGNATNHDTLDLRSLGFASIADVLSHTDPGANAVIHAGANDITLLSITEAQLAAHQFVVLV